MVLLFQGFGFEIIVKSARINSRLDHLSRLEIGEDFVSLDNSLPGAQLFALNMFDDHYRDIVHILTVGYAT